MFAENGKSEGYAAPIVVKIGGALLDDAPALEAFWRGVRALRSEAPVVIVHGGGAQASAMAERLGHTPRIVEGRRVTSDLDLKIMQWTLRGALNTELVAQALGHGLQALGLSGADGGFLRVEKRPPWQIGGEEVDFGWVGDVVRVETRLLDGVLSGGFVPVVAPLGVDDDGHTYNVNADTVAEALAEALGAAQLLLVTGAGSVYRDPAQPGSQLATCDAGAFATGVEAGWISGGMRVKLQVAFAALRAGVPDVFVLGPRDLVARAEATQVVLENGVSEAP